jgi:glucokinase
LTVAAANDLFPWLVADIGGTNARFGLVRSAGAPVEDVIALKSAQFETPEDAAGSYLDQIATRHGTRPQPQIAAYAVAAAIRGDTVRLTNHNWTISRPAAMAALGARRVLLLNDFEALALALPRLSADESQPIGNAVLDPKLPMAVIGPGTGLGVATCVPTLGGGWIAVAAEGGHVSASAADDFEAQVLSLVRAEYGHVSAERVLSGIGLPNLYRAIVHLRGGQAEELEPAGITERALANADANCVATLDTFCAMLGSFAGNVALTVGARGGVFISGGIVPRLGAFFLHSRFRERFEAKGRFAPYLAAIATALVTARHPAMTGAAQAIELQLRSMP